MSDTEKQEEVKQPSFEINDAKDEVNALSQKPKEEAAEDKKEPKDKKEGDDNDSEKADDNADAGTEKKKKPRAQKRIEKLSAEKRELQKQLEELKKGKGEEPDAKETEDLDPDNYDNYDDYLDALDEQEKKVKSDKKDKADEHAQGNVDADFQKVLDDIEIKFDDARDKYEDFDDLVKREPSDGGPAISPIMLEAMNELDNAGDVAYELAKDPTNSIRIANLKPIKQILEIDKLSAKLAKSEKADKSTDEKQTSKKSTTAPDPINVLGGGDTPRTSLADAQNFSDYESMRRRQQASKAGW